MLKDMGRTGCWAGFIGLIAVVFIVAAVGIEAAGYEWYKPWVKDKQTEITRNSNNFVDGKVSEINGLLTEIKEQETNETYFAPTPGNENLVNGFRGQQMAFIEDLCNAVSQIDAQYVPNGAWAYCKRPQ